MREADNLADCPEILESERTGTFRARCFAFKPVAYGKTNVRVVKEKG